MTEEIIAANGELTKKYAWNFLRNYCNLKFRIHELNKKLDATKKQNTNLKTMKVKIFMISFILKSYLKISVANVEAELEAEKEKNKEILNQ